MLVLGVGSDVKKKDIAEIASKAGEATTNVSDYYTDLNSCSIES